MKKKILIVEDNSDSREILQSIYNKDWTSPHKGPEQLRSDHILAEAEEPDLIFMDMDLPDVDGIKTTAMLRQNPKTSHIPVVALTAWMSALWQEKAEKVGITTYLIKPISPQMLKETIEEYTNSSLTRNPLARHEHPRPFKLN